MTADPRGSNWRKWDLHIHTPASYQWRGVTYRSLKNNPTQRDKITKDVIDAINSSDVSVFCIMDYWTFDGYLEIRRFLRENPHVECKKTIFPGIELRIESPADFRLNIHVILSDKLSDQQIQDFKSRLKLCVTKRNLSDEAIILAARDIGVDKAKVYGFSDPRNLSEEALLELGSQTIEISRSSLEEAIREIPSDSFLLMVPYDTYNGLERLKWKLHPFSDIDFMRMAQIFEVRSEKNVNLITGVVTPENEKFIDDFIHTMGGSPKLPVSGSDAHSVSEYGRFPSNKITWIKAEPSFEGLLQAIIEPKYRAFIGEIPSDLVRVNNNKTKYIRSLRIERSSKDVYLGEIWFNCEILFNHGLVAVIGNKGNGKSALVDIVAILCEYHRKEYLSFLNVDKFCNPKSNKAQHFHAYLTWENDIVVDRNLNEISNYDGGKVRYIPQHFFERICNETELKEDGEFNTELKKVIFSHVKEHDRFGFDSIDPLISHRTSEISQAIANLRASLSLINKQIVDLEKQLTNEYRAEIERTLQAKRMELEAHETSKPKEVPPPIGTTENAKKIGDLRESLSELDLQIQQLNHQRDENGRQMINVEKLMNLVDSFRSQYDKFSREVDYFAQVIDVDKSRVISLQINDALIIERRDQLSNNGLKIMDMINEIEDKREKIQGKIREYQSEMNEVERKYQQFLTSSELWSKQRVSIIGNENETESITYYEQKLKKIDEILPIQLERLKNERLVLMKEIYACILRIANVYRDLYKPVQKFIDNHSIIKNKYKLSFQVSVALKPDFASEFLSKVKQNVAGPFRGKEEGEEFLKSLINQNDFSSVEGVSDFVNSVLNSLGEDIKLGRMQNKLRNISLESFYDYLFGLSYLITDYGLLLDNKSISQLSPGERGILLLIFYLLVDNNDCPLIIDQPEENLDNQSIYEILVPCVKEAKSHRQIILVTHNANLAVVCDADQIIHAYIDKHNGHKITYKSGAIEDIEMNKILVDILEGTWPAFTKRRSMYREGLDKS